MLETHQKEIHDALLSMENEAARLYQVSYSAHAFPRFHRAKDDNLTSSLAGACCVQVLYICCTLASENRCNSRWDQHLRELLSCCPLCMSCCVVQSGRLVRGGVLCRRRGD